jgi:hypothetical protein
MRLAKFLGPRCPQFGRASTTFLTDDRVVAGGRAPMKTFIRAVEVWIPNQDRLLEFGGARYESGLEEFREISELAVFGYGEGLPGMAWAAGHPIILTDLVDSYFRRADEARMLGLSCAVAIPIFAGDVLKAVVGMFFGRDVDDTIGAIELWHNEADHSHELSLADGYYGAADAFEFNSRKMKFPRGYGLPGRAWKAEAPIVIAGLGDSPQFLRAKDAASAGIGFALAIPYMPNGKSTWVITFLSSVDTPFARRFEIWKADAAGDCLRFDSGYCAGGADLAKIHAGQAVKKDEGCLGGCLTAGMPILAGNLSEDKSSPATAATKAGLKEAVILPVFRNTELHSVIAMYS